MKNIFRFLMVAFAATAAMTACQHDNLAPDGQGQEGITLRVTTSLSDDTKASLSDNDYLKWAVNDVVLARGYNISDELIALGDGKVLSVDEESNTAVYEFTGVPAGAKLWLGHNANNPSARKFEFNKFASAVTQDAAGQVNKENLMLVSEMIEVPADAEGTVELSAKMRIVGSLLRFLVYSSEGVDESVKSIKLEVKGTNLSAGGYGCLAYYFEPDGSFMYWADNNDASPALSEQGCLFYPPEQLNYVTTVLTESLSLSGIMEPTVGTGIYMPVAPVKASGYIYTVTTDAAVYTFDASTVECQFLDNQLKNVLLNLDKGARVGNDEYKGELRYVGTIDNISEVNILASGAVNQEYVQGYAQTKDVDADWIPREGVENLAFYENVSFAVIDDATGETATWLTVKYGGVNNSRWVFNAEANEGEERTATVTATFSDVNGYVLADGEDVKEIKVIQAAANSDVEYTWGALGSWDIQIEADAITSTTELELYFCLAIGGSNIESWADDKNNEQELYSSVKMTAYVFGTGVGAGATVADWIQIGYGKDANGKFNSTHPFITVEANNGEERKALVWINVDEAPDGYVWTGAGKQFIITQAGRSVEIAAVLDKTYDDTVPAEGADDLTLGTLALTIDGVAAGDVAAAMTEYGVTATADNGATVSVASDGTVTMDIPANPYANGVKEYTVTVKYDGNILATAKVNQAEGTEEGGSDDAVKYGYEIKCVSGWSDGTPVGFPANFAEGHYFTIQNVSLNGEAVTIDDEIASALIKQAFKNVDERPAAGYDNRSFATTDQIHVGVMNYTGSTLMLFVRTSSDSANTITRLEWYNSDGTLAGYIYAFV